MPKDNDSLLETIFFGGANLLLPDPPEPTPEERIADALEEIASRDDN